VHACAVSLGHLRGHASLQETIYTTLDMPLYPPHSPCAARPLADERTAAPVLRSHQQPSHLLAHNHSSEDHHDMRC
jgi:hypothetical protein